MQQVLFGDSSPSPSRLTFAPRDYQEEGIRNVYQLFDEGVPGVLYRQPTGTGKTVSGAFVIDEWLRRYKNGRAIVLCHEQQLINQFADEIDDVLGVRPEIEMGISHSNGGDLSPIIVASRQSLYLKADDVDGNRELVSRLYKFDNMKYRWLVIIDECHRWKRSLKSASHIIQWFEDNPDSRRLGLTATPERSDGVSPSVLFPGIACDYLLNDHRGGKCAVNDGWAVPYVQAYIEVEGVDFKAISKGRKDFTDDDLAAELGSSDEQVMSLVLPMLDLAEDRLTLIFSPSVEMAKTVCHQINAELILRRGNKDSKMWGGARWLDGSVPEFSRRPVYKDFESRRFQFLSVCSLCREGYNNPSVSCVAVFRPTKSRSLAEQMKGRCCRPLRGIVDGISDPGERKRVIAESSKPNGLIIDLVGITGLPDTATTAEIMAEGVDDEVVTRANIFMLAESKKGNNVNVNEALKKAEDEILQERIQEERRQDEEINKWRAVVRSQLTEKVNYQVSYVDQGRGGGRGAQTIQRERHLITDKQLAVLKRNGIPCDETMSKGQASRLIGFVMDGKERSWILRQYHSRRYPQ